MQNAQNSWEYIWPFNDLRCIYFILCMRIVFACLMYTMYVPDACVSHNRILDPQELESQLLVRQQVDSRKKSLVLCKTHKGSINHKPEQLLSALLCFLRQCISVYLMLICISQFFFNFHRPFKCWGYTDRLWYLVNLSNRKVIIFSK